MDQSLRNKTVIITGATSGIGKVAAADLADMGAKIFLIGRNETKGKQTVTELESSTGNSNLTFLKADLSRMDEVRRLAAEINSRVDKIDVLLNNAGAIFSQRRLSSDGYEMTLALNDLSPFLLTHLLMEKLEEAPSARIINTSSSAHRMANLDFDNLMFENGYNTWTAYGNSKLANILFTNRLARNLENTKITANVLHPGFVKTNFGKSNGDFFGFLIGISQIIALSEEEGAKTSVYLASSPEVEGVSGKFFVKSKPVKSSAASNNQETADRLWDVSLKLTGID